jgi:hypothetical protein
VGQSSFPPKKGASWEGPLLPPPAPISLQLSNGLLRSKNVVVHGRNVVGAYEAVVAEPSKGHLGGKSVALQRRKVAGACKVVVPEPSTGPLRSKNVVLERWKGVGPVNDVDPSRSNWLLRDKNVFLRTAKGPLSTFADEGGECDATNAERPRRLLVLLPSAVLSRMERASGGEPR